MSVLEECGQQLLPQRGALLRAQAVDGAQIQSRSPVGPRDPEVVEDGFLELHQRDVPLFDRARHLPGGLVQLTLARTELGEATRAEGAEGRTDAVEEPDLRFPGRTRAPGAIQERIDQRVLARAADGGLRGQEPCQIGVARAQRPVGCVIRGEDLVVRFGRRGLAAERVDEMEGVPHPVAVPALGVAAVRLLLGVGGEEAADVAGGLGSAGIVDGGRERPRVALAHDHHDLNARRQASQKGLELPHGELLAPEGDGAVVRIVAIAGAMIGHEDQQLVAGKDLPARGLEPLAQRRLPGGMQGHRGPVGVDQPRLGSQAVAQTRALEKPEIRGGRIARREVRGRVLTVRGEHVGVPEGHTPRAEEADHVLQVVQVTLVIRPRPVAAVDQERVDSRAGSRGGRGGDGRSPQRTDQEQDGARPRHPSAVHGVVSRLSNADLNSA